MAWDDPPKWDNQYHFVGPYKHIWEMQNEINELGKAKDDEEPWHLFTYELTEQGWLACMSRSVETSVDKKEKVKSK